MVGSGFFLSLNIKRIPEVDQPIVWNTNLDKLPPLLYRARQHDHSFVCCPWFCLVFDFFVVFFVLQ